MSSEKRYYIAYGSNLNMAQMVRRCPNAVPIGTAVLEHNTLYFRGSGTGYYLTIEPKIGGKVPVAIWEVTPEDEQALDRYEGFPKFYYKHYIMTDGRDVGLPTPYYMATCIQGYKDFGFDTRILKRTVERMRKILWKRKNLK